MKFSQYLKEASTKGASDFEKVIVAAYNGGSPEAVSELGLNPNFYEKNKLAGEKIAEIIKKETHAPAGDLIHFGSGKGKTISWWTGTPTPKTDMYTSKGGINISLKKKGGSQLASGLPEETKSTFRAAQEYMDENNKKEIDNLISLMEPVMRKVTIQGNINGYKQYIKTKVIPKQVTGRRGKTPITVDIDPVQFEKEAKQLTEFSKALSKLTKEVQRWFSDNPNFKVWFVYEAATGETKFKPDPNASANWLVAFDPKGGATVEQLSGGFAKPTPYIKSLSKKTKISTKVKTGSGSTIQTSGRSTPRNFSLRLDVKESTLEQDFNNFTLSTITETVDEIYEKFGVTLLSEGVTERISNFITKKIKKWLSDLYEWIMTRIKQAASKGYRALMDYLGMEVIDIKVSGLAI